MTDKHPLPEALRVVALIRRAGNDPQRWPQALLQLRAWMDCPDVFGAPEPGSTTSQPPVETRDERPQALASQARNCAERGAGRCGGDPYKDEIKRQTCLAMVEHLEMALVDSKTASDPADRLAAAQALDAIDRPLFVCDQDQRLLHANRSGHDELGAGRWVTLLEGRIELVPNTHVTRLRGELRNLLRSPPNHQSHVRYPPRDGQRAELLARRLSQQGDPQHRFLLRLVVLAQGRMGQNGLEHISFVERNAHATADGMTPRQRDLAKLLLAGCNVSEAARRMGIQRSTASDHMKGLFTLSHTTRQVDLVAWLTHVRLGWDLRALE